MKNLGYINIEKIKDDLSDKNIFFRDTYWYKENKLIGKDEKEYLSLDLLDYIPLIEEKNNSLKINFELSNFIKVSIDWIFSKIKINASSGDSSQNASSGDSSQNASSGYSSKNEMLGYNSVSVDASMNGKAKGKLGCWFCLSEWIKDKNDNYIPYCVKSTKIDGKKIKEDTWYTLKNGKFIECN